MQFPGLSRSGSGTQIVLRRALTASETPGELIAILIPRLHSRLIKLVSGGENFPGDSNVWYVLFENSLLNIIMKSRRNKYLRKDYNI